MTSPQAAVHSAQGKDFSSNQPPVTSADLDGLQFAFARVSDWARGMGTDANFAHNWAAFKAAKIHRGAYWFLEPGADPVAQAKYFVHAIIAAGLEPGDMLVCDSEVEAANADAATGTFCHEVDMLTVGKHTITMVYADHVVGQHLTSCTRWPLWFAWPSMTAPPPDLYLPWKQWHFWQWGQVRGVDADAFNGTPSALNQWVNSYRPAPRPVMEAMLVVLPGGAARKVLSHDGGKTWA